MLAPAKLRNPGTKRYIFLNYIQVGTHVQNVQFLNPNEFYAGGSF